MAQPTNNPASGWYLDPLDPSKSSMRYWTGSAWSSDTRPKIEPPTGEPIVDLKDQPTITSNIPILPDPESRRGLFGGKKDLEEENLQLREILNSIGVEQRDILRRELEQLSARKQHLSTEVEQLQSQLVKTSDALILQEVGIYQYHHPLQNSVEYKAHLDKIEEQTKALIKSNKAVTAVTSWTVNGSEYQGQKMVKQVSKLMLRAYIAEADNCIRSLKPANLTAMTDRLSKTRETIATLGQSMQIQISNELHKLKISEIQTTADFLAKKEVEKAAEKEIKAQLREEEKVAKEIAAEKAKLEKEKQKIVTALKQMQESDGVKDEKYLNGIQEMQATLESIDSGLTGLTERAANTKAGHVYVISNVGAFGSRVVKIGMTRRVDPEDRVKELSDASVPFKYGIHALFFSSDAAGLETALHQKFSDQRVNLVNKKREFFYVTPAQVRDALVELDGHVLEFDEEPDDNEFRQSEYERLKRLPPASN